MFKLEAGSPGHGNSECECWQHAALPAPRLCSREQIALAFPSFCENSVWVRLLPQKRTNDREKGTDRLILKNWLSSYGSSQVQSLRVNQQAGEQQRSMISVQVWRVCCSAPSCWERPIFCPNNLTKFIHNINSNLYSKTYQSHVFQTGVQPRISCVLGCVLALSYTHRPPLFFPFSIFMCVCVHGCIHV